MVNNSLTAAKNGPVYDDGVVRAFSLAAVLWGVVGMLVVLDPELDPEVSPEPPSLQASRVRAMQQGRTRPRTG